MLEPLGYLSLSLVLLGLLLVSRKQTTGWLFMAAGCALWTAYYAAHHLIPPLLGNIAQFLIVLHGYIHWRRS